MHTYADLLPHPARTRIRSGRGSVACLAIRWTRPPTPPRWSATIGQGVIESLPASVLLDTLRGNQFRYAAFGGVREDEDAIPFMRIAPNHDWLAVLAPPTATRRLSEQTRRRMDLALKRWSDQSDPALDGAHQRRLRRVY